MAISEAATMWTPGIILPTEKLTVDIVELIKDTLLPQHVVALTAWAEARARFDLARKQWVANPIDAMQDIMNVIDNRANDVRGRWTRDHKDVCLMRRQFSCWAPEGGAQNFAVVMRMAQEILAGDRLDVKLFACLQSAEELVIRRPSWLAPFPADTCHYYSETITAPAWAVGKQPVAERFGHRFFAGID